MYLRTMEVFIGPLALIDFRYGNQRKSLFRHMPDKFQHRLLVVGCNLKLQN